MNTPAKRASCGRRLLTMSRVGLRMLFHAKLKLLGTVFGVVFAVVLSDQQAGTFLGVVYKSTMFVDRSDADLWLIPSGVEQFGPGPDLSRLNLAMARATRGVVQAAPIIVQTTTIKLPQGGGEQVTLIGTEFPYTLGGPWSIVRGSVDALVQPNTMIFEGSDRKSLGGLNLGSSREVGSRQVSVGGFTWGLLPFGPSYAFGDFDLAREMTGTAKDRVNYVLVKVAPGASVEEVKQRLVARADNAVVLTGPEFRRLMIRRLILKTAIGVTFGTSTLFGLMVGFVIVSLSMFSSVVDNLREFGTLKAVGATNVDLMILLFAQAIAVSVLGTLLGLAIVFQVAVWLRNPKLAILLPPWLTASSAVLMAILCVLASTFALQRIRKVEPAMVFR